MVGFDVEIEDNNERKTGLRRRDTPYYKKNKRIIKDDQSRDKVLEILAQIAAKKEGGDGQVTEITKVCLTFPDIRSEFHRTEKISSFSCSDCFQPRATNFPFLVLVMQINCIYIFLNIVC